MKQVFFVFCFLNHYFQQKSMTFAPLSQSTHFNAGSVTLSPVLQRFFFLKITSVIKLNSPTQYMPDTHTHLPLPPSL